MWTKGLWVLWSGPGLGFRVRKLKHDCLSLTLRGLGFGV